MQCIPLDFISFSGIGKPSSNIFSKSWSNHISVVVGGGGGFGSTPPLQLLAMNKVSGDYSEG